MLKLAETTITRYKQDDFDVFECDGRLDQDHSQMLESALAVSLRQEVFAIIVDISKVAFLNSACMRVLISTAKRCRAEGGNVELVVDPNSTAYDSLETAGLLELFSPYVVGNSDIRIP